MKNCFLMLRGLPVSKFILFYFWIGLGELRSTDTNLSNNNSIQFSLFPAHINISYNNNNVYILCRKRGGQKTMLMDVRPVAITVVN